MSEQDDLIGKKVGPFQIISKLGSGAFSTVYLSSHIKTGEQVAIKYILKSTITNQHHTSLDILSNEINNQKKLYHNNLSKIYCTIETNTTISIVQEYCSNGDLLTQIMDKGLFDESTACLIFNQLISGLEYLHMNNIAHRDLKPENILFDYNNDVKLCDFGLSKDYSKVEMMSTPCGSPIYAAPEMVMNKPYKGASADIWSAGVTLYAMVAGRLPFDDEDMQTLFYKISKGIFEMPEDISDSCKDIIKQLLTVDIDKRATFEDIKRHQWFNTAMSGSIGKGIYCIGVDIRKNVIPVDEDVVIDMIDDKVTVEDVVKGIVLNKHNKITSWYYLMVRRKIREGKESISDFSHRSKVFMKYIMSEESLIEFYGGKEKAIQVIIKTIEERIKEREEEDKNENDIMSDIIVETLKSEEDIKEEKEKDIRRVLYLPQGEIDNQKQEEPQLEEKTKTPNKEDPAIPNSPMISDSTEPKPTSPIIPTPPPIQSNTSNKKSSGSALPRLPIKLPQFTLSDHKQKSTRSSRKKSLPSLIIEPPRFSAKASNKTLITDREYHPSKKPNPTKKKETKPLPHNRNPSLVLTTNTNSSPTKPKHRPMPSENISSSYKNEHKYTKMASDRKKANPNTSTNTKPNTKTSDIIHYKKITNKIKHPQAIRNINQSLANKYLNSTTSITNESISKLKPRKHLLNTSVVSAYNNNSRFNTPEPNRKLNLHTPSSSNSKLIISSFKKPNLNRNKPSLMMLSTLSNTTRNKISSTTNRSTSLPNLTLKKQPQHVQSSRASLSTATLITKKTKNAIQKEISGVVGYKNVSLSNNTFNIKYETKTNKLEFSLSMIFTTVLLKNKTSCKIIRLYPHLIKGGQCTYELILNKIKIRLI